TGPRPCLVRWKTRFLTSTVTFSRSVEYPGEVLEQPCTELCSRHHLTNCPKKPNAYQKSVSATTNRKALRMALIFPEGLTNARGSGSCHVIFWPRWSGRCCYLICFSGFFPFLQWAYPFLTAPRLLRWALSEHGRSPGSLLTPGEVVVSTRFSNPL